MIPEYICCMSKSGYWYIAITFYFLCFPGFYEFISFKSQPIPSGTYVDLDQIVESRLSISPSKDVECFLEVNDWMINPMKDQKIE